MYLRTVLALAALALDGGLSGHVVLSSKPETAHRTEDRATDTQRDLRIHGATNVLEGDSIILNSTNQWVGQPDVNPAWPAYANWTSSNPAVATVDYGPWHTTTVHTVAAGTTTITATLYNLTATYVVTVMEIVPAPTLSGSYVPAEGQVMSWTSVPNVTGYTVRVYDYCTDYGGPDGPWGYSLLQTFTTTALTVTLDPNSQCPQEFNLREVYVEAHRPYGVGWNLSNVIQFYP